MMMKKGDERDNERNYSQSDAECLTSPGNNRSVFELTESGASKVLFDDVQFHLDGLFALKSTPLRVQCACKLIEICTSSKQVLYTFRNNGIAATLLRVVGLLASEVDSSFRLCLLALALILCQSDKGDILEGFDMPRNVFASLLSSILQQKPLQAPITANIISKSISHNTVTSPNEQLVLSSKFSRKRKFGAKKGATCDIESPLKSPPVKNIMLGIEGIKEGSERSVSSSGSNSCGIVKQLQQLWPSLFIFCGLSQSYLSDENVAEMSQFIALTVVSRYLTSLVHYDTQIQGHKIDSSSADDDISLETENDSDSDAKAMKNPMLHEYQTMLRHGSSSINEIVMNNNENHRLHDTNIDGNFLTGLIVEISNDLISALIILKEYNTSGLSSSKDNFEKIEVSRINRIFQVFCLLEAACFREPENQMIITSSKVSVLNDKSSINSNINNNKSRNEDYDGMMGWDGNISGDDDHIKSGSSLIPFPRLVLSFLSALFPFVASRLQDERCSFLEHANDLNKDINSNNMNINDDDNLYTTKNTNNINNNDSHQSIHNNNLKSTDDMHVATNNSTLPLDIDKMVSDPYSSSTSPHVNAHPPPGGDEVHGDRVKSLPKNVIPVLNDFDKLRNLFPELPAAFTAPLYGEIILIAIEIFILIFGFTSNSMLYPPLLGS